MCDSAWRLLSVARSLSFTCTMISPMRSVVQVSLHARCVQRQMPMVDDLMQFIDLGGRRCDAAATSSSCRPRQLECRVDFLGPCTQVQGREPCPQGHGSHN